MMPYLLLHTLNSDLQAADEKENRIEICIEIEYNGIILMIFSIIIIINN